MRTLNYKTEYQKLLSPEIVSYLAQIHEQKGQQNLFIEAQKDALSELLEIAKIGRGTLAKLSKNQEVSMSVLVKICNALNCELSDIAEITEND